MALTSSHRCTPSTHPRRRAPLLVCLTTALFLFIALHARLAAANPQRGLPPPPEGLDRSTPQRTAELFLDATREGDFVLAAYALDLRHLPTAQHSNQGPELARQLRYVLDRGLPLNPADLSDTEQGNRDDGLVTETLGHVRLDRNRVAIRLARVPSASGRVWVFSTGTVRNIARLHEALGPGWAGIHLPDWAHRVTVLDVAIWQWTALLLGAVVCVLLAWPATWLLLRGARRLARRTPNPFDDALVRRATGPVRMSLALLLGLILVSVLKLSIVGQENFYRLISTLLILAVTWLTMRFVHAVSDVVLARMTVPDDADEEVVRHGQGTRVQAARRSINGLLLFVGLALALSQLEGVRRIGVSLLASAGIIGVVIGFAAQKPVANLLAGLQISLAQPIRIGDRVRISGDVGLIEEVTLSYVTLKTWDGRRRIFPITYFIENEFENWTRTSKQLMAVATLHVDYRTPIEQLRQAVQQMLEGEPAWDGQSASLVVFEALERTLVLRVTASAPHPTAAWELSCRLREGLVDYLQRLDGGRYLPRTRMEWDRPEPRTSGTFETPASRPPSPAPTKRQLQAPAAELSEPASD